MDQTEIHIDFSPTICRLIGPVPEDAVNLLYEKLAFRQTGYFFAPRYQSGLWDGYTRLFNTNKNQFKCGLLSRVVHILHEGGYVPVVRNKPASEKFEWILSQDACERRPYQIELSEAICRVRFGIAKAPPRTGKTNVMVAVSAFEDKFPVTVFCRSIDLCEQTVDRFRSLLPWKNIGYVSNGVVNIGDVTVITIQSAYFAYKKKYEEKGLQEEADIANKEDVRDVIESAKIVFYDEVHHGGAKTSRFILGKSARACMKIGLSATPFAGAPEDLLIEETLGPVIHEISYSKLIREGYLLKPTIYMYTLPALGVDGNYRQVYSNAVVENDFLYDLIKRIVDKLLSLNKSVVIQTDLIKHTKKLGDYLGCETLTGQQRDASKRKDLIARIRNKEVKCVVSTVLEEGIDLPQLDYTINASGGLSSISTLQKMRSITAVDGKTTCGIIDFYHQCKYLEKHSKARLKAYKSEPEFEIVMRDVSN